MSKKTYKFNATVAVHDPALDEKEVLDVAGRLIKPFAKGIRYVSPGEPVEMEQAEGDKVLELVGHYEAPVDETKKPRVLK